MRMLKQSVASNVMVFMTQAADHVTGLAGATLTITISKDGGAFASVSPTVTDRGNGWYAVALTAAHTDTIGDLALRATATSADPTDLLCRVVAGSLDADVSSRLSSAGYTAPLDAAGTRSAVGLASANLDTQLSALSTLIGTRAEPGDAMTLTAGAVDAVWDEAIAGGYSARELIRGFASALMAKLSGADASAPVFRDVGDTKNRISATTDANGNRTAVTLDLT